MVEGAHQAQHLDENFEDDEATLAARIWWKTLQIETMIENVAKRTEIWKKNLGKASKSN
ncbi:unnamed protein product [Cylicostephanus goldi]|uniref:Uncharacterized protein n=1 Tax=Cylicostephanus goldi TaxID=71465 RepID=A0A3P7PNX3_CYLGO|nr:unnamed protein product [Cylicostephanus goldi]